MKRAYAELTIKASDGPTAKRLFSGTATTPTPDRSGDIVVPKGAVFKLPIALLWQHRQDSPIGWITKVKVTDAGIDIEGEVADIPEDGKLKDRINEAWQSMKYGLVRGLSIGFNPLKSARIGDTWSYEFLEWEWLELSAVTIPANAEASLQSIKSICLTQLAATGRRAGGAVVLKSIPGASGTPPKPIKEPEMKTIAEQIAAFETKRAANADRMSAIMAKAADENRTLDAAEEEEYDTLATENKSVDTHIVRLKAHEANVVATATPITKAAVAAPAAASAARAGESQIISVRSNIDKGIAFTRYVKALVNSQGNPQLALMYAENQKQWRDESPQVAALLKTAVAGGTTIDSGWASQLVHPTDLIGEFVELLRPMTIIGKLKGMTNVPFNVRMSGQDSGSSAQWVGQGKPIPVSKMNTIEVTLGMAKVAGMVVLTKELMNSSAPSAEMLVRNDMMATIATFSDVQFVDPNVAAVSNVSPASITNGLTALVPTGTTAAHLRADVQTLFGTFIAANDDPTTCAWIMDPVTALAISLMQNALGQPEFPNITMFGGTFFGLPVVVSNSANIAGSPNSGHLLILVKQSDILFADEGGIEIDASQEASIQMLDNPTNASSDGTATTMVSMFQTNSVALRAIRAINWKKRRSTAVAYIKEAQYVA